MTQPTTDDNRPTIDRREAIRRAALLAGVAISPAWLACADQAGSAIEPRYLTAGQLALVTAAVDRIIPPTDTPGASDVGVPAFLDLLYGEFMDEEERELLIEGLDAIDAASATGHGAAFDTLTVEQQDAVLRQVAEAAQQAEAGQDVRRSGFRQLRTATVLGYFSSEEVGRNVLHYDPVPGRFDACIPIDEVGNVNWTT